MNSFNIYQNPFDQHDAQDAAEQHYLQRADRERSRPRRQEGEAAAQPSTHRHPQAGETSRGNYSAGPVKMNSSYPHLGGASTSNPQQHVQLPQTTYSPFPSPKPLVRKPISSSSSPKPLARNPVSKERTATDSPSSVLSFASNVPTPQITHVRSRPFDSETARPQQHQPTTTTSRSSTPIRPSSSASNTSSFFHRFTTPSHRRGSNASNNTSTSSSRPDSSSSSRRGSSISATVRRASSSFKQGTEIVKMDPEARLRWRAAEKSRMEDEIEERRRQEDPARRPAYQQEYLVWKAQRTGVPADSLPREMSAHERTIALDSALRGGGGGSSKSQQREAQRERDARAPLTAGEEIALLISQAVDPLRRDRRRKGSDDSGMDFADCGAPVDGMESCKRCGRPVGGSEEEGLFLRDGYCPRCHRLRTQEYEKKEFWETDSLTPSATATVYSSSSKSSSPLRPVNEEEYMKLQTRDKRIRRIRRTIYEDPGNPFSVSSDHSEEDGEGGGEVKWNEDRDSEEEDLDPNDAPPPGFWGSRDLSPAFSGMGKHVASRDEFDDILGRRGGDGIEMLDARDSPMHAPTPQRIGTPALIKVHSVPAMHTTTTQHDEGGSKIESTRKGHSQKKDSGSMNRGDAGNRDTAFYGFYDDVLREYRQSLADLEKSIEALPKSDGI